LLFAPPRRRAVVVGVIAGIFVSGDIDFLRGDVPV
jgi:hypothetical protein